ncbi:MAG: hypothetical protein GY868_09570 [Deltaproteobacteria bacterium]|nr:hypothetical protein [Deltaproteobacteria bacterium]
MSRQTITPPAGSQIDTLSGDFVIFQPLHGQRYTTDDLLAGWLPIKIIQAENMPIRQFLDLGSGLCSVPMIILWAAGSITGFGIELRRERFSLGRLSLCANDLAKRFHLIGGDLRSMKLKNKFSLVTSSPPYYEKHEGPVSPNHDKAGVRFELRGSIDDYCRCASSHLHDGGFFTTIYPFHYADRLLSAASGHNLFPQKRIDVIPRTSKPPLLSLFAFCKTTPVSCTTDTLSIRNKNQSFSEAYQTLRAEAGFRPAR